MFVDLPKADSFDAASLSVPIALRLKQLFSRKIRVAWIYENPDTSTFRYRALNMVDALQADGQARVGAAWFSAAELPEIELVISKITTLVVARYRYSAALHRLVGLARRSGVRVLFESDDLVFDTGYAALIADTLAQDLSVSGVWDYWFAYMGRLGASAKLCDGGITTNGFLANRMKLVLEGKRVAVVPNFLNREQQEYSELLLAAKRSNGWKRNGSIIIGYFSGSPTHRKDFEIAAPALARLLRSDNEVRLRIVGFLDIPEPLRAHADRVEVLPHMDYVTLQHAIAEVEINIAPLQENIFTNCKSDLKFFEAAAVGTWTIATPTYAFEAAIEDGKTGRLAHAHQWDFALEEAISLVRAPRDYETRSESAASYVYSKYGWSNQVNEIISATLGTCSA